MAIAVQLDFKGSDLDQYDEVIRQMGFQPGGRHRPGLLFHWVTGTAEGTRVIDVWESREQFDAFAMTEIGPVAQAVGVPMPPDVQFYDVHNYLTAG